MHRNSATRVNSPQQGRTIVFYISLSTLTRVEYDRETDTLSITLRDERVKESDEIRPGIRLPISFPFLASINIVRTNVHRHHDIALDVEDDSQVGFNVDRENRAAIARRELVDLVRPQTRIEGISFENLPGAAR